MLGTNIDLFGRPEVDAANEVGLFLSKDSLTGLWELTATAGGGYEVYTGSIISDNPAEVLELFSIDETDIVDTTNPSQIDFVLKVGGIGLDTIRFQFPDEAMTSFTLDGDISRLQIGSEKSSIDSVPLDLNGF